MHFVLADLIPRKITAIMNGKPISDLAWNIKGGHSYLKKFSEP